MSDPLCVDTENKKVQSTDSVFFYMNVNWKTFFPVALSI